MNGHQSRQVLHSLKQMDEEARFEHFNERPLDDKLGLLFSVVVADADRLDRLEQCIVKLSGRIDGGGGWSQRARTFGIIIGAFAGGLLSGSLPTP